MNTALRSEAVSFSPQVRLKEVMADSHTVEIAIPEDAESDRAGETASIEVSESEYVLAAARSQDVWLPADCQQGWCTTCAARLVAGEIDQSDARRYYDSDEDADLVLPCTAKPRSDLRLEAYQQEAILEVRADHDLPPGRSKR